MNRLLTLSIAIFTLALATFVVFEIKGQRKLSRMPDSIRNADTHSLPVSAVPPVHTETVSQTALEKQNEVLEDLGITDEIQSAEQSDDNIEELFDKIESEEECCPEEELIEGKPKRTTLEIMLAKYLPQGHARVDIERYAELSDKEMTWQDMQFEEEYELWDLTVKFEPTDSNLRNYERWKKITKNIEPGSWTYAGRGD